MADTVRGLMEAMVPELEDYETRGYFSRAEIGAIVQRRQTFEYNLRRRNAVLADYLRYYEYEWKLEQLRRTRRKLRSITGKRSLADYGLTRRIHFIFERATRRFKGDLAVWSAWLAFCKESRSTRQVSKVVTKALKLHPSAPFLWTYAAAWEFESNGNPAAARQIMQSGLRNCPASAALWLEYFRMEVLYANRLAARRHTLGLLDGPAPPGAPMPTSDSAAVDDASEPDRPASAAEIEDASPAPELELQQAAAEERSADELILQGRLAQLVHDEAVQKLPDDAALRRGMLRVVAAVPCIGSAALAAAVAERAALDFRNKPEGCVALAGCIRDGIAPSIGTGPVDACHFLARAVKVTRSLALKSAAVTFAADAVTVLEAAQAQAPEDGNLAGTQDELQAVVQQVLACLEAIANERVEETNGSCCGNVAAIKWQCLLRCGKDGSAAAAAAAASALQMGAADVRLCEMQLRELACDVATGNSSQSNASHVASAVTRMLCGSASHGGVSDADVPRLLAPAAAALLAAGAPLALVCGRAVALLRTAECRGEEMAAAVAALYQAVWHAEGTEAAEAFAFRIAACPTPGAPFWLARAQLLDARLQQLEASPASGVDGAQAPSAGAKQQSVQKQAGKAKQARCCCAREQLELVLEQATRLHGDECIDLWVAWVTLLRRQGRPVGALVQRAVAALRAELADAFVVEVQAE